MRRLISILLLVAIFGSLKAQNSTRASFFLPAATNMQVNTYTGELYYERAGLYIPSRGLDFEITFNYNSSQEQDWGYGAGWSHNYNIVIEAKSTSNYVITWGNGSKNEYTKSGNDFTPPVGVYDELTEYEPSKFLLTTKYGMKYYFNEFNNRVSKIEDRNGNALLFTYNTHGFTSITGPAGRVIQIEWQNGRMSKIIEDFDDPVRTWQFLYNNEDNVEQVINPLDHSIYYYYVPQNPKLLALVSDENNNETTIKYRLDEYVESVYTCLTKHEFSYERNSLSGNTYVKEFVENQYLTTKYNYDEQGRNIYRSGNCCGNDVSFVYNNENNIQEVTDANGNTQLLEYDNRGNIIKSTNAAGCYTEMQYDIVFNQLVFLKDKNGNEFNYSYDLANGNLIEANLPLGINITSTYDSFGNFESLKDGNGHNTTYDYNANGYLTQINHTLNNYTTQFNYDNRGRLTNTTDANNHTSTFEYDLLDRLEKITDPLGFFTINEFDAKGNLIKTIDKKGNSTLFIHDNLDRVIEVRAPQDLKYQFSFDGRDNLLSYTDPLGGTTTYNYNTRDFIETLTDPLGFTTAYEHDGNGNQTSVTDAKGNTTSYEYDPLNRLRKIITPLGNVTEINYDCNNNPVEFKDANGKTTENIYDELNRIKIRNEPLSVSTNFTYDKNNNLKIIEDANTNKTTYDYDELNRQTKTTYPDGTQTILEFDGVGNVTSRFDASGYTTEYTYDELNRLILRDYPGSNDDSFDYDELGNLVSATNQNATVEMVYDEVNRMISETLNGKTTQYIFNPSVGKVTLIYPSGKVFERRFDKRGQLKSIHENNQTIVSFQYEEINNLIAAVNYSNNTSTNYTYDDEYRTTNIAHALNTPTQYGYEYDAYGNKQNELRTPQNNLSREFGYDDLYRLTEFRSGELINGNIASPVDEINYNYDNLNNRQNVISNGILSSYTSNSLNQYTNISGSTPFNFSYDDRGNLINVNSTEYQFDFENRLISVGNGNTAEYKYDALGRRVYKKAGNEERFFYYSNLDLIEERGINDNLIASFVFGRGLDDVQWMEKDGEKYFYHKDALGSVSLISDFGGNTVEYYTYSPFGKASIFDGNNSLQITSSIGNPFYFTGQVLDFETGYYFYKYRYYSPETGKFLQRDPLGYTDGFALYDYTYSNPVNWVDPLGLAGGPCGDDFFGEFLDDFQSGLDEAGDDYFFGLLGGPLDIVNGYTSLFRGNYEDAQSQFGDALIDLGLVYVGGKLASKASKLLPKAFKTPVENPQIFRSLGAAGKKVFNPKDIKILSERYLKKNLKKNLKKIGIDDVHDFKRGYVDKNHISFFDIARHTKTNELVIVRKSTKEVVERTYITLK